MTSQMVFNTTLNPRSGKRERLAVSTSVVPLTAASYLVTFDAAANKEARANLLPKGAVLQVTGADSIYYTLEGSTPSGSVGFLATSGDYIYLDSFQKIQSFKAIRVTSDTSIEALYLYGN